LRYTSDLIKSKGAIESIKRVSEVYGSQALSDAVGG